MPTYDEFTATSVDRMRFIGFGRQGELSKNSALFFQMKIWENKDDNEENEDKNKEK